MPKPRKPKSRHMTKVERNLAEQLYSLGYRPQQIIGLLELPHSSGRLSNILQGRGLRPKRLMPARRETMHAAIAIYELVTNGLKINSSLLARTFGIKRDTVRSLATFVTHTDPAVKPVFFASGDSASQGKQKITPFLEKLLRKKGYLQKPLAQSQFVVVEGKTSGKVISEREHPFSARAVVAFQHRGLLPERIKEISEAVIRNSNGETEAAVWLKINSAIAGEARRNRVQAR